MYSCKLLLPGLSRQYCFQSACRVFNINWDECGYHIYHYKNYLTCTEIHEKYFKIIFTEKNCLLFEQMNIQLGVICVDTVDCCRSGHKVESLTVERFCGFATKCSFFSHRCTLGLSRFSTNDEKSMNWENFPPQMIYLHKSKISHTIYCTMHRKPNEVFVCLR